FFFQAEDGIRDRNVTGVQTCALPISQFTRAIYRAQQWIYETDNMTIAETIQPYFDDVSIDIIAQSVERYKEQESFATSPLLQESAWDNLLNVMDEAGELRGDAPYDLLVNRQIAEKEIGRASCRERV